MSSNTKKQCDDVLVVWCMDSNWPVGLRRFLEEGEYRLLFCLNIQTLMETLTAPSTDDTKILLVIPANLAPELLPIVHDKEQIVGIDLLYVGIGEINNYQSLSDIYPKLLGVYEGLPSNVPIIEQLKKISKNPYMYDVFDKDLQSMLDLSKFYKWFKNNRVSPNMQPDKCKNQLNKDCFFSICRMIYALDPIELKRIDEFERNYRSEDAINWYSKDCFVFKVINSILRSDTVFPHTKVEYVVDDICFNLQSLWQEQQRQNLALPSTTLRFYRGLCVPNSEIDRIKASQGNYVAFKGFLSTTKSYEIARIFARNVLCEIEVNPQLDNLIFADISQYSQFDEQEVLFSLYSTFFLSSVQYDDDDGLWKIKLIGVSENEIIENQLKYQNFTFDGQQQEFIGDQWFEFEQYDKCISSYEKALLLVIDQKNKIDVFYKLAKVYLANKQFDSALSNALDAYTLIMSIHPPSPSTILELLLLIAVSYACVKNYDRSIEYHVKYLILAESNDTYGQLDSSRCEPIKSPQSFWNGAHNSYFYTPPLTHLLETLTKIEPNNDILAKIHLNISILYGKIRFGEDERILKHFNAAKQLFAADSMNLRYSMWHFAFQKSRSWKKINVIPAYKKVLKLLDLKHSQIIMIIHYAIARCYYENRKYTRTLHHLRRALKIDEQYSSNDELCAKILYMIGVIHDYSGRTDLALEAFKRSLFKHNTLAKTNPTNCYDSIRIANITEAIATCYFKNGDLDNCLTFTQISLEQYLSATPDYLHKHAELNFKLANIYGQLQEYQLFIEHLNRSLSIQEVCQVYGGESIAAGYNFLSMMHQSLHQLDLAIASLLKALNLLKCSSSSLSLDSEILAIEERLATLYSEMLDYPSALVHSCEMLHILEKTKPWCKQQIASIQNNIGWFYYKVGDLNNALISCQKSFELFQECFRSSNTNQINSELTYVLNSLGHIYLKSGDQTKALDYCQKSLQALEHENETGQHIKAFADNYELLADIYMQYGRQTLSFDYYLKALQLYQQLHVTKTDHSDIQRVLTSLKNINEIEF